MIEVINLAKKYNQTMAIDGISFKVEKGEIFGFLGPNGAGKTTTINILTGLLSPASGQAFINGYDVVKQKKKIKEIIGVVFEYQNLYPRLTGWTNLDLFRKLYRLKEEKIKEMLEMVQLLDKAKDPVTTYSRGMKQRLLIARALINKPVVLFLDEPTSGLDPHSAYEIRQIIKNLCKEGITVFLNTHYLEEAEDLCNRVGIIEKGKIIALDKIENLKASFSSQSVAIKLKDGENGKIVTLSMDDKNTGEEIKKFIESKQILSIHTAEPTLEEVFLKITNRGDL